MENNIETFIAPEIIPVIGSPFSVYMYPDIPDASQISCRGLGLREAPVNTETIIEVTLFDKFHNRLIRGGYNFFTRLRGARESQTRSLNIIPDHSDLQNGQYLLKYEAPYHGNYALHIQLLENIVNTGKCAYDNVGKLT